MAVILSHSVSSNYGSRSICFYIIINNWLRSCAVEEFGGGGTAEHTQIPNRSGHHDDRSSLTRRLHDVP